MRGDLLQTGSESYDYDCFYSAADHFQALKGPGRVVALPRISILPAGEQYTYKCLSCPFSSMTISQLKEHSLRDHGEALTLPKLRAATQAAHAAPRPSRLASNTEQTPLAPDGNYVILLTDMRSRDRFVEPEFENQPELPVELWIVGSMD